MNSQRSALAIIRRLQTQGFTALLAGGCVRDRLLGLEPQDFDVATSASVEEITNLFEKTVTVGARFGVVLVLHEGASIEVATFRQDGPYSDGRKPDSIERATPQEDAERRDFTINGLFFDPEKEQILDYVGGQEDLKNQLLKAIGDPYKRFKEDRLRMLRAVRFSCRFSLVIEEATAKAIREMASLLFPAVSPERAWQEMDKMRPHRARAFLELYQLGLLQALFPKRSLTLAAVQALQELPEEAPLSFFLASLFIDQPLPIWLEIAAFFKVSKAIQKEFELFHQAKQLSPESPLYDWALYLAHDDDCLALKALKKPTHLKRQLKEEIERLKTKKPLLDAAFLQKEGIKPGPLMGKLLKKAEILAINERIGSPEELFRRLKTAL